MDAKEMHNEILRLKAREIECLMGDDDAYQKETWRQIRDFFEEHKAQLLDVLDDAYYAYLYKDGRLS